MGPLGAVTEGHHPTDAMARIYAVGQGGWLPYQAGAQAGQAHTELGVNAHAAAPLGPYVGPVQVIDGLPEHRLVLQVGPGVRHRGARSRLALARVSVRYGRHPGQPGRVEQALFKDGYFVEDLASEHRVIIFCL